MPVTDGAARRAMSVSMRKGHPYGKGREESLPTPGWLLTFLSELAQLLHLLDFLLPFLGLEPFTPRLEEVRVEIEAGLRGDAVVILVRWPSQATPPMSTHGRSACRTA